MIIKATTTIGNTGYYAITQAGKIVAEKREGNKIISWVYTTLPLYALFDGTQGINFDN